MQITTVTCETRTLPGQIDPSLEVFAIGDVHGRGPGKSPYSRTAQTEGFTGAAFGVDALGPKPPIIAPQISAV
jgi:hypothetical protein